MKIYGIAQKLTIAAQGGGDTNWYIGPDYYGKVHPAFTSKEAAEKYIKDHDLFMVTVMELEVCEN